MKNYKLNKKFQFLFPFLFIIGIVLIFFGFNDKESIDLTYEENNNINYNVYLKDNNFFDTPYLGENRTYIASLIDYIDVFFHYNISYNRKLTGKYTYKYVALVRANKKNSSGYYWEKEYKLSDEKTVDMNNSFNVSIEDNIKVKYSTYNDILSKFKKEYGISTDGELKVVMKITNIINKDSLNNIDRPINIDSEISLSIPLLEQSFDVSINKDTNNNKNILSIDKESDKIIYLVFKVSGISLVIISVFGFIYVTKSNIKLKKNNLYELTLDNILNSYDSIIASVTNMPNISDLKRIEVDSFNELLDVYNEVRMPINHYQDNIKNESTFIIINDSIVWVYILKKNKTIKRVDNDEKKIVDKKRK